MNAIDVAPDITQLLLQVLNPAQMELITLH